MLTSFKAVLNLLPDPPELADMLDETSNAIRKWKLRDSIPPGRWPEIAAIARARGHHHVTEKALAELRAAKERAAKERDAAPKAKPAAAPRKRSAA